MNKQTITIELDVPEGYELTGEFRHARKGENYIDSNGGRAIERMLYYDTDGEYFILKKINEPLTWPEWPEWLTAEWMVMWPGSMDWYATDDKPGLESGGWMLGASAIHLTDAAASKLLDLPPFPSCDDWRKSLIRNPHLKDEVRGEVIPSYSPISHQH